MQSKTISRGETPEVVLDVRGNLILTGIEHGTEINISTRDDARLDVQEHDGKVIVNCNRDVEITVPEGALIRLPYVRGNAELTRLRGGVDIDRIHGDLRLDHIGKSHIHKAYKNLVAHDLGEAFSCDGVGGNATIVRAACPIELNVGGNLELQEVPGPVQGNAGGNARLTMKAPDDAPIAVRLSAGGQAWLDVSGGNSLQMNVTAGGNIDYRVGKDTNATVNIASGRGIQTLKLGDGSGVINLACGGNVNLLGVSDEKANHNYSWQDNGSQNKSNKATKSIRLGEKRVVVFEVGISLKLEGYDGDEVIIERGGASLQDVDGEIHVEAGMDCRARVPNNTVVRAEVGADAQVSDFEGELKLEAGASARVKDFTGIAHIEAGAEAKVDFVPTGDSKIEAGALARCWIPDDANVTVNLSDMQGERTETFGDGSIKIDLTAGMNATVFDTGGEEGINIGFDSERGFVAGFGPEIEKQILEFTSQMTSAAAQLSEGVSTIPMPDWLKGEVGDMHRRVEEATRRAQERIARKIESATRRAERKSQKTGKRVNIMGDFDIDTSFFKKKFEFDTDFPRPPAPPQPPQPPRPPASPMPAQPPQPASPFVASKPASEPVSEAERMTILRMLEQKKITVEQAAQLLAAMGE